MIVDTIQRHLKYIEEHEETFDNQSDSIYNNDVKLQNSFLAKFWSFL